MSALPFASFAKSLAGTALRAPGRITFRIADWLRRRHCLVGQGTELSGTSRIDNLGGDRSSILIGANTRVAGQLLTHSHGGRIAVGNDCFIGEGTRIWSADSVIVGDRVLISHGVNIHDTDSHSSSARLRHEHFKTMISTGHPRLLQDVPASPIVIDDDARIGFNAVLLKGVRVGRGAIVGAGSVVTKDVAPFTIVAGCPAQVVGASRP